MTNQVIDVIEVVKATQRIPSSLSRKRTFFSMYDLWMYTAVLDDKLCEECLEHEKRPRYSGSELRTTFPYLEIVDEDTINANVHPNCRCFLTRVTEWTLDDIKWFLEYVGD